MPILGNSRKAYVALVDTPGSSHWLAGEQTNSFNRTTETIEVSDKSTEWAQFIAGKKGATAEITVYTDDTADGPQFNAIKALHNGSSVRVFIGTLNDSGSPAEGDLFYGIVTAISDTNDNGALATRSISVTASGAVTHYPTIS